MQTIIHGIVQIIYAIAVPVLRLIYPHKMVWEDKEETMKVLNGSCLIYSNHTGYSDGLFMTSLLSRYNVYIFVGRDWYEKKKLNWLFRNLRYIPIDRQQMDTSWIYKGKETLEEGKSIYFFPEGHTSKDGNMLDFKPGFLMLAKQSGVPLVPICIDNKMKPFHMTRIIIGKSQTPNLREEGRPSAVLKKHAENCKKTVIELKKKFGNPKYATEDVKNY
ncbi:MAG: 1-acyl-sn-glycerol-3-phosphate acyltransferase [Lachnospiraceae bacterium]|nr:1-acyl-sn-glycerol-3-phosphate acyltransferase [Lachnospiraceae bacterium]